MDTSTAAGSKQRAEPEGGWKAKLRSLKACCFACGLLVILLLSLSVSLDWLQGQAGDWSEGLFGFCVFGTKVGPAPFDKNPGCHKAREVAYVRVAAALCVVALFADVIVTLLTLVRILARDQHFGNKCRCLALGFAAVALLSAVGALVLCPVGFALDLDPVGEAQDLFGDRPRLAWTLGPGYILGWTAALGALCELVLLFCDAPLDDDGSTSQVEPVDETRKIQVAIVERDFEEEDM